MSKKVFKKSAGRKILIFLLLLLSLLLVYASFFYLNLIYPIFATVSTDTESQNEKEIPFILGNLIEIPVKANGIPAYAIFDTGSNINILDEKSAGKFNIITLPLLRTIINGKGSYRLGIIRNFEIGNIKFKNIMVVLKDFKTDSTMYKCMPSEFFIGTGIIRKANWKFNFKNHSLKIFYGNNSADDFIPENSISYSYIIGLPFTKVKLNEKPHRVMVDFGYTGSLWLPLKYYYSNYESKDYLDSGSENIHGKFTSEGKAVFSNLVLGKDTLKNIFICFSDKAKPLLGTETFLNYSEVLINWPEKKIYLAGIKRNNEAGSRMMFGHGFSLDRDKKTIKVSNIFKNSPAYNAGLNFGDTLMNINGTESSALLSMDYCDFLKFRGKVFQNDTVRLKIKKEGQILYKEIVIAEF